MEEKREINAFLELPCSASTLHSSRVQGMSEKVRMSKAFKDNKQAAELGKSPTELGRKVQALAFHNIPLPRLFVPGFGFSHMFSLLNETQMRRGFQSVCSLWLPSYVNLGVAILTYTLLPDH